MPVNVGELIVGEVIDVRAYFVCSSRENRYVRLLGRGQAMCRKGLWRSKKMQHNMGLCCMNGQGGGGGVGHFFFLSRAAR